MMGNFDDIHIIEWSYMCCGVCPSISVDTGRWYISVVSGMTAMFLWITLLVNVGLYLYISVKKVWSQRFNSEFYTKGRPLVKSNLICPSDKLSWQPGCPVLNINIQGNFFISQRSGSSDNLPENLV